MSAQSFIVLAKEWVKKVQNKSKFAKKRGKKVSPAKGGERNRQIDTSRSKREKETQRDR
jgi:hypothetical protein